MLKALKFLVKMFILVFIVSGIITGVNCFIYEFSDDTDYSVNTGNVNYVTTSNSVSNTLNTTQTTTNTTTVQAEQTSVVETVIDTREPNYQATNPDYQQFSYSWTTEDNRIATLYLNIDLNAYYYYASLDRYYGADKFVSTYLSDDLNRQLAKSIAESLRMIQAEAGYSDWGIVCEAINFVQQTITYQYDIDGKGAEEYPKYMIETLVERTGDCEDSAMLLADIIRELGYSSVLFKLPGHVAVGLYTESDFCGSYYTCGDNKYYYIESTNPGWEIGVLPSDYQGVSAKYYKVK